MLLLTLFSCSIVTVVLGVFCGAQWLIGFFFYQKSCSFWIIKMTNDTSTPILKWASDWAFFDVSPNMGFGPKVLCL